MYYFKDRAHSGSWTGLNYVEEKGIENIYRENSQPNSQFMTLESKFMKKSQ